jgi:hypothetical protein
MKSKMDIMRDLVPSWIVKAGGNPANWILTIFDVDPPILNELTEYEEEARAWPTPYTFRIKDKKGRWNQENWRRETYEFFNALAQPTSPNIYFDALHCDFLHDQLLRAQARHGDDGMKQKGWIMQDVQRSDHVADAFIMALFTILAGQFIIPDQDFRVDNDPYADAKKAFEFRLREDENRELSAMAGSKSRVNPDDIFREVFGRGKSNASPLRPVKFWSYKDY